MTEGYEWPSRCDAPDLSKLSHHVSLTFVLRRVFTRGGPSNPVSFALVMNFVRIVDALRDDYQRMRDALHEYVTTPNNVISPLFYAISHAEECTTNLLRAIRLGQRIRSDRHGPRVSKLRVLASPIERRVRDFRNEIEHIDRLLVAGENPPAPHCLMVKNDRLDLYGKEIMYAELAAWITSLHALSEELATYQEQKKG
jgi:hypothetical protein